MTNKLGFVVAASGVRKTESDLDRLRGRFEKLQKQGAKGFVIGAGAAITTAALNVVGEAVGRVTSFLGDSVDAASALDESLAKSGQVFRSHSSQVENWAKTASDAFGQSEQQALEAAGTYGNLLRAFGVGADQATEMSKALVELASDLASFNNTSVDDALVALRSGLSGETEPLKRYGIALSNARMRSELLAQGHRDLGATLTPLQKTTAAYAIIMRDSSLAQGDFARTSTGLANQQRILDATMSDLQATLGEELLPIQLEVTRAQIAMIKGLKTVGPEASDATSGLGRLLRSIPVVGTALRGLDAHTAQVAAHRAEVLADAGVDIERILADETTATYDALEASRAARFETDRLGGSFVDLGAAAGEAADDVSETEKAVRAAEKAARDAAKAFDELSDEIFGADIKAGDLAEAQEDLAEALKDPPQEGAAEWTIWNGKVAEAKQRVFDLEGQLARMAGDESYYRWLLDQQAAYGGVNDALSHQIELLRAKALLESGTAPVTFIDDYIDRISGDITLPGKPRARGGPVTAGSPYVVGEEGPELFVPRTSGTIVPNGAAGGGWSGGGGLTFVYSPTYSTASASEARAFAAAVGPDIIRWARSSGVAV